MVRAISIGRTAIHVSTQADKHITDKQDHHYLCQSSPTYSRQYRQRIPRLRPSHLLLCSDLGQRLCRHVHDDQAARQGEVGIRNGRRTGLYSRIKQVSLYMIASRAFKADP